MPLTVADVSFSYGATSVIKKANFEIGDGIWLSILGPNGSGRTTLARLCAGILRPEHGEIYFEDQPVSQSRVSPVGLTIGLVMQRAEDQFLGPTVFEDVAFGPRLFAGDPAFVRDRVQSAVERVGFDLADVQDRSPLAFSGGQRRRLSIAAILALRPKVLILDEPFSGLERPAQDDVRELLVDIKCEGTTLLTFTSSLEHVASAEKFAVLLNGEVTAADDVSHLIQEDLLPKAGIACPEFLDLIYRLAANDWELPMPSTEEGAISAVAVEWSRRRVRS